MIKFFLSVIELSIGPALVISVMLALLTKTKYDGDIRYKVLLRSVFIGLFFSILSTIARVIPHFVNRTNLNFYSMIPLVLVLLLYMFFVRKSTQEKNFEKYKQMALYLTASYIIFACIYYLPRVYLLANTFASYGEPQFSSDVLMKVMGYVCGIIFTIAASIGVHNAAVRLNNEEEIRFFGKLSMIILGATQITVIVQRLYSLRIIPRNKILFQLIAFITNKSILFIFLVILALLILPIILIKRNNVVTQEEFKNPALERKVKANMRTARRWSVFVIVMFFMITMSLSVVKHLSERQTPLSPPEPYVYENDVAYVPVSLLDDMHLHRFEYKSEAGRNVRFIVIQKSKGSYSVCFDACEVCGPSGYYDRGENEVICKLCDVVMNRGTIGFRGGCNPIPMEFTIESGNVQITKVELEKEAERFR